MEELTYEQLREVQKKERSTGMLSELPEDFYEKAGALVAKMKAAVSTEAIEKAREYDNALKVARDIYSVREQKILLRSLRAAKGNNNLGGLSNEERAVYEKVKEAVADGERKFESLIGFTIAALPKEGEEAEAPAPAPEPPVSGKKLHILSPVPQFVGLGGGKFGPFLAGEIVYLPEKEGELLVRRKLAAEA